MEIFDEIRKRIRWPNLPEGTILPFPRQAQTPVASVTRCVKDYWVDVPADGFSRLWLEPGIEITFAFMQSFAQRQSRTTLPTYYERNLSLAAAGSCVVLTQTAIGIFSKGSSTRNGARMFTSAIRFLISSYWKRFKASDWECFCAVVHSVLCCLAGRRSVHLPGTLTQKPR